MGILVVCHKAAVISCCVLCSAQLCVYFCVRTYVCICASAIANNGQCALKRMQEELITNKTIWQFVHRQASEQRKQERGKQKLCTHKKRKIFCAFTQKSNKFATSNDQ